VRRYGRLRCRSAEHADDAVQDTFLRHLHCSETRIRNREARLPKFRPCNSRPSVHDFLALAACAASTEELS
jgi:hypothetical protein